MSASVSTIKTKCPYHACAHAFEIALPEETMKVTRPVPGHCPTCGRAASFKPLDVLEKIERNVGKQSDGVGKDRASVLTVALEDVRSLWNVGSIFRTADGAGFDQLYLLGITGCPPRKEIAKVSLGAEDQLAWKYYLNAVDIIPQLRSEGTMIVGLERNTESVELTDAIAKNQIQTPLCLIVGNEVTGLSLEALALCDLVVSLPMRGFKESLNVAVAFGVASYLLSNSLLKSSNV